MELKPSRVLEKLRKGELVSCFKVNLADSRIVEIVSMMGFDCVWADLEHVPNDLNVVERQVLSAKAWNTDLMVRVSRGGYSDYIRPLEMDASGIMVPHIMDLEDAKNVVKMTRFHPIGRRPVDGGNSDGRYCNIDLAQYMEQANERRFVAVQIEDPEPMDHLDEIASLEGIDMLFFGPSDFSHGLGIPGQMDHPEVLRARKMVAGAAIKHGKFAGTVGSTETMNELTQLGYRFINLGSDVNGLNQYLKNIIDKFNGFKSAP